MGDIISLQEHRELLDLLRQFNSGEIKAEDLTDRQIDGLIALYKKEIKKEEKALIKLILTGKE